MDPQAPARLPQPWERQAARGPWGEVHHGPPLQPRRGSLHTGPRPRPGSWDGGHPPGHPPRRDAGRLAALAERYESSYPSRPYSRQGYEDPHWQYPAASYGDDYTYQSYQRQPVAWQGDRDLRQGEHYSKSTNYQDQHYYKGYHPNLAASSPAPDRKQTCDPYDDSYTLAARKERAGGETHSGDLGEAGGQPQEPSDQPSLLLQYRESGLSSSGYELSQYIREGADHYDPALSGTWGLAQAGRPLVSTPAPVVPLKFSVPHTVVCFGARGQLVLVCPRHPAKGQLALVELHSLEVVLHGTKELEELQAFPGPLAREDLHKVDVMAFCQQKIATSCDLSTQRGRDSCLLWKLLVLLCRQNGSMVGSDTAELLMEDCRRQKYKRQNPAANLIGLTDDEWMLHQTGTLDLITGDIPPVVETQAQIVEKFTKLLYYGRKKDALVWAMRNHLWGHAHFLSSKMDPRTYSWVLSGFTSTLVTNDPLQTLFQLMSGRIPQAALCCGDGTWGDWRPHLAVLLSNKVGDTELNHRAIVTMGDTLAGKGSVEAAHFCYLMADIPFGYFGVKADRMALLGSSHRQGFAQFARMEAIQRTEIFEYCQRLRQPESFLLPFQIYKLLYASLLVDYGLPAQALQYCEQIATVLLSQDPSSHPVLAQQVMKLAERLKLSDPLLLEMPEQDQMLEPDWLVQLQGCCREWEVEDDLPLDVSLTQPGLSCAAAVMAENAIQSHHLRELHAEKADLVLNSSILERQSPKQDEEPGHELPQSEGYQHDQYQPVPPQGSSSQQDVSFCSLAPVQDTASPLLSIGQELQPPVLDPGTTTPLGVDFAEPPLQPLPPAGEAGEPWGALLSPEGMQPSLPKEQEGLKAQTVSETSTVSLEDDSRPSSESVAEDTAEELASAEALKLNEDKNSGFRWFGWFRSKPTKETSPRDVSETSPDSPTPELQEQTSPFPSDTPLEARRAPSAQPPSRNPGLQGENAFAITPLSIEMKGSWESAGEQTGFHEHPPPVGAIPLFNPLQVSQLITASRPTQPRLLSQWRYPNPL